MVPSLGRGGDSQGTLRFVVAEGRSSKQGKSGLEPLAFEGLYVPGWGNGLVPDAPTRRDWDINSEAELRPPPPPPPPEPALCPGRTGRRDQASVPGRRY